MSTPASSTPLTAQLYPTAGAPLTVGAFTKLPASETPGNVGVCLSGGGSRAMTAGMGALQALETMTLPDGSSLLSRVKALSSVSGGSWLSVPFTFLTPGTADADFLGTYTDPATLSYFGLDDLRDGNAGANVTDHFSLSALAVKALALHVCDGVPWDMLWQTLIAMHMLEPYGLFGPGSTPSSLFSYDQTTLGAIVTANPSLASEPANLVAQVSDQHRPYYVCNTSLFATVNGAQSPNNTALAPVQCTPFFTGVVSAPNASANGAAVGGGGVDSFAFASQPTAVAANSVTVQQQRQWALADIVGTSSAAFAVALHDTIFDLMQSPPKLAAALAAHGESAAALIAKHSGDTASAQGCLSSLLASAQAGDAVALAARVGVLDSLVPAYQYWPVPPASSGQPPPPVTPVNFADGGSLENLGVASMLAYGDVDNLMVFANTETILAMDDIGNVVVDDSIPPLFGYQPYEKYLGYVPYPKDLTPKSKGWYYRFNTVFPSAAFQPLLTGLWEASGSGSYSALPVFTQQLTTVANPWFGVAGNKQITVVWSYLESSSAWSDLLAYDIQALVYLETKLYDFPHYNTLRTELSARQINLLANLVAWSVSNAGNAAQFTNLFTA